MKDIYIVNCCRTAVGSFGGSLKDVSAVEMGSIVVKEALKRSGVAPENVDEVIFGARTWPVRSWSRPASPTVCPPLP